MDLLCLAFSSYPAICLFLICLRIDVRSEKVRTLLVNLSPAAFGVYLIDNSTCFYQMWLSNRFAWIPDVRILKGVLFILLASVAMFVCFLLIEAIRLRLHNQLRRLCFKAMDVSDL